MTVNMSNITYNPFTKEGGMKSFYTYNTISLIIYGNYTYNNQVNM